MGKELKRHFSKADIQIANKHRQRCSIALNCIEIQVKTRVSYHLTLLEWPQ